MSTPQGPGPYPPPGSPIQPFGSYQPPGLYPPQVSVDDSSSGTDQVVFAVVCLLAGVALGFATGWLWAQLADPPTALVTDQGVFVKGGESAYDQRAVETLWFMAVTAGVGLLAGFIATVVGRRHGVATVVAVIAMSAVAGWLSGWSGVHLFGPDAEAELATAVVGDTITSGLDIGTWIAYLGWPIGALLGTVIGISLWRRDDVSRTGPAGSSNVWGHWTSARGQ